MFYRLPSARVLVTFAVFITAVTFVVPGRAQVIDTSFDAHVDTSTVLNHAIEKILVTPDGKMIASGRFNRYNGRTVGALIRVNPDGSIDNSFKNDLFQSEISSQDDPKMLPDGKILICGTFTINDVRQFARVVRLNANGTLDNSFQFEPTGVAAFTRIDSSGRVLVLGNLQYTRNGQTISRGIVRLNPDGTVDDAFSTDVSAERFTTQGNKVVYINLEGNFTLHRLNEDGSPDASFTQTAIGLFSPHSVTEQSDHKLVILRDTMLIRVNADGGLDGTFQNPTLPGSLGNPKVLMMADDRMVVRYASSTPAPFGGKFIRLLANGGLDPSFTMYSFPTEGYSAYGVHLDGSVMIGDGNFDFSTSTFKKLLPSGQVDTSYNAGGVGFLTLRPGKIRSIRVLPSNKILIGGDFDRVGGTPRAKIALLNPNSSLDASFQINTTPGGNYFSQVNDVYNIERQADGKILISGAFTYFVGGVQKRNVVRLNSDGSIDPSFVLGVQFDDIFSSSNLSTNKPAYRADGKIVVANGRPNNPSPDAHPPVQLSSGGARDTTFTPNLFGGNSVIVFDVAVLPDGKILIAGRYSTSVGSETTSKGFVAQLNSNGTTDATFQVYEALNKVFVAIAPLSNGKVLMLNRPNTGVGELSRLNANGTVDNTFTAGSIPNGRLNAIAVADNGRILVGGSFTTYNGEARRNLVLLTENGELLPRLVDTNKEVLCLALDNQGRVLVGGFFTSLSAPSPSLAFGTEQQVDISYLARINLAATPTVRAPFDFDGDGKTDIGIFRPAGGASEWWINRSSTGVTFALQFGASTDRIAPADYTGDVKTDIAFFRPASGEWYVLRSEDFSFFALPFGTNGDIPVPADYDADGKADFAVMRPSNSTWFISQSSGAPTRIEQFGAAGDVPVVSDYDGDGKADVAIFRNAGGAAQWWINRSTAGLLALQFGASTDKAVQGDYTGDGKADVAIWRPSTGEWFIVRSEDFSFYGFPFGTNGDMPSPGDYDGDGKFDPTVFRPSSATWFIARTTAGTQIVQFGATGDRPLPNAFVP